MQFCGKFCAHQEKKVLVQGFVLRSLSVVVGGWHDQRHYNALSDELTIGPLVRTAFQAQHQHLRGQINFFDILCVALALFWEKWICTK